MRLFNLSLIILILRLPPRSTLFPYTTLFRSAILYFLQYFGFQEMSLPMHRENPAAFLEFTDPRYYTVVATLLLAAGVVVCVRSEEHTSELQSRRDLVCRLLLEKKKQPQPTTD